MLIPLVTKAGSLLLKGLPTIGGSAGILGGGILGSRGLYQSLNRIHPGVGEFLGIDEDTRADKIEEEYLKNPSKYRNEDVKIGLLGNFDAWASGTSKKKIHELGIKNALTRLNEDPTFKEGVAAIADFAPDLKTPTYKRGDTTGYLANQLARHKLLAEEIAGLRENEAYLKSNGRLPKSYEGLDDISQAAPSLARVKALAKELENPLLQAVHDFNPQTIENRRREEIENLRFEKALERRERNEKADNALAMLKLETDGANRLADIDHQLKLAELGFKDRREERESAYRNDLIAGVGSFAATLGQSLGGNFNLNRYMVS